MYISYIENKYNHHYDFQTKNIQQENLYLIEQQHFGQIIKIILISLVTLIGLILLGSIIFALVTLYRLILHPSTKSVVQWNILREESCV